jgi:maleylacetate reductase
MSQTFQETFTRSDEKRTVMFGSFVSTSKMFVDKMIEEHIKSIMIIFTKNSSRARKEAEAVEATIHKFAVNEKINVSLYGGAWPQVPIQNVEASIAEYKRLNHPDAILTVGGGSAIGLGKATCYKCAGDDNNNDTAKKPLPYLISVVTTYSGSEMTNLQGITRRDGSGKDVLKSNRMIVKLIIYDPVLLKSLPDHITVPSVFNAMAHAVEVLWGSNLDEKTRQIAKMAIEMIATGVTEYSRCTTAKTERDAARSKLLYGAYLCGAALGSEVELGIHHKLAHVLGGTIKLPHADAHCVLLPYSIAYNRAHCSQAMSDLMEALANVDTTRNINYNDPAVKIFDLQRDVHAPKSLKDIGMQANQIDLAANASMRDGYSNPRPYDINAIKKLYDLAFHGERPTISSKF